MNPVLPAELIRLRKLKGRNQQYLADALRIPVTTYPLKERKGDFTEEQIHAIAQALGVSPQAFTEGGGNDIKNPATPSEQDYKEKYIALLEKRVATLEGVQEQLTEITRYLTAHDQKTGYALAFCKSLFLEMSLVRAALEKRPAAELEAEMGKRLAAYLEETMRTDN